VKTQPIKSSWLVVRNRQFSFRVDRRAPVVLLVLTGLKQ
jgi:hypothetical protein